MSEKKTILDCALHWEKEAPDMLHCVQPLGGSVDNVKTWTFAQALKEARRVATYLERLGLPPKSRIAICSKNCAHWILADWAIWMAGHISVPLYPVLNADTVRYILEHSGSSVLLVDPGLPYDRYRATLVRRADAETVELLSVDGLAPSYEGQLAVVVPSRLLTPGEYDVVLTARMRDRPEQRAPDDLGRTEREDI